MLSAGPALSAAGSSCSNGTSNINGTLRLTDTVPGNSNSDATRLALVQSVAPGAVQIACSFTSAPDGKSGTWTSTTGQTVTHILVKASTVQQVYDAPDGTTGNWTTECIVNNGNAQPAISGVFCYGEQSTTEDEGTITIVKQTVGGTGKFGFNIVRPTDSHLTSELNTETSNPISSGAFVLPAGAGQDYKIIETSLPSASWELTEIRCESNFERQITNSSPLSTGDEIHIDDLQAGEHVTCTFTNRFNGEAGRKRLTLLKTVINDDGLTAVPTDFTLSFSGPGGSGTGIQGSKEVTNADVLTGDYKLSETGPGGYALKSISCDGSDADGADGLTISPNDEAVTCTFTNDDKKDDRASEETKRFVHRRLDNLLTYGPDRARMLRRLGETPPEQQSLKDGPMKLNGAARAPASASRSTPSAALPDLFGSRTPTGSMSLGANPFGTTAQQNDDADPARSGMQLQSGPTSTATGILANMASQLMPAVQDSGTIKFSTSLSELRAVATAAEQQRQNDLMMKAGLNFADTPFVTQPYGLRPGLDVWVEGTIVRYNDDLGGVNRDGDFSVLYVGADYVVSPGFLIGALIQVDDTDEDIDDPSLQGRIDGRGWLAGPYIGIRLAENLYFDARAAWGQSDNDIDLTDTSLGQRTGSFETDRWLASATLTGNEYYGAWRFTPQVSIAYGEEDYGSYTTSLAQTIPGSGASIGRMTGTMEVGYRFDGYGGSIIEPHVAISGIWNFDSDDLYVNGILAETDESRARVEGGLLITTPSGVGLRGAAGYDGIGADDFEAVSGSLWINVPLN